MEVGVEIDHSHEGDERIIVAKLTAIVAGHDRQGVSRPTPGIV